MSGIGPMITIDDLRRHRKIFLLNHRRWIERQFRQLMCYDRIYGTQFAYQYKRVHSKFPKDDISLAVLRYHRKSFERWRSRPRRARRAIKLELNHE